MHIACENGHKEAAEILVELGARVNEMDVNGNNAITIARGLGHDKLANALEAMAGKG